MSKSELAQDGRDDSDLIHFRILPSLKISRTASKMLSQVVILEDLDSDGRYIPCWLAIVDILGAYIFSRYLRDLVTVIIPRERSLRRQDLDMHQWSGTWMHVQPAKHLVGVELKKGWLKSYLKSYCLDHKDERTDRPDRQRNYCRGRICVRQCIHYELILEPALVRH